VTLAGLAGAVALVRSNRGGVGRGALFPVLLAYVVLVVAYQPAAALARVQIGSATIRNGLYIFSFPIQQILIAKFGVPMARRRGPCSRPPFRLTLALATVSWHVVEQPALRLKSRFH